MKIEDRIQDIELRAKVHAARTMMRFHGFIGSRTDHFKWAARLFNAVLNAAAAPLIRAARAFASLAESVPHLELVMMEDDCAECGHDFDAHQYLNTLECSFSTCDCMSYVDPEDVA